MNRAVAIGLVALLVPQATAVAGNTSSPADVANGFYRVYSTFHPSDGIPDDAGRALYVPFISMELEKLLANGHTAEIRFAKENKDSPPMVEGDLFTSNFEGATSFDVSKCSSNAKLAHCSVSFVYDPQSDNPKDSPVRWTDTIYLVMTPAGWRVDDVQFGATWAFADSGRLKDLLKEVIRDGGDGK